MAGVNVASDPPYHSAMTAQSEVPTDAIELLVSELERSIVLDAAIRLAWEAETFDGTAQEQVPVGLCALALEHGHAVRTSLPNVPPSAIALLRTQYESLVRAVWARDAASPRDLGRLMAPLTPESQQAARSLPGVSEMLSAIEKVGPRGEAEMLGRARTMLWDALNSFIHGGIHPFHRGSHGYPVSLLQDVLKNLNAMPMLTLLLLADIVGKRSVLQVVQQLTLEFNEVLPELLPASGGSRTGRWLEADA